ncbi:MAG: signal recognition particle-docking protein FtsY [Spiroplasma poulsonii]|uniref:Signal recognition particle receptor FtsY n=1 Tax=Spiroplasma poulsonii TaxID=2138 RepID=A0A2P6FFR0_9MOLU|nr:MULTISPECIES: signal recognition particle-docking protein FtsY [Spiroplasma]KAF0850111.1 Signal recognition particle receptor FtsY [Spiroplasma poulsonii]MBH8622462.1 signal recognition particle-docking protein FtsY [Spiroplasma sp. hyd1]MBW1242032.1 signal recognition particle-docking protein FtsY [Spiroplasma poulsonii]PQM32288.1 Signal recognition particle receptor FtsY [Spiroplasma poulsonii]PWF94942.1 Signal recognition particle receptor FtsY [Spiroplasma poulsonii]
MGFFQRLKAKREEKKQVKLEKALRKTRLTFSNDIKKLANKYKEYDDEYLEDLEAILIASDMGMNMVLQITDQIRKKVQKGWSIDDTNDYLVEVIMDLYNDPKSKQNQLNLKDNRLNVILMVGVNGAGKTTTLAKLAKQFLDQGKTVLLVAGDTFRAGAVEQLNQWAMRLKVNIVKPVKEGQDPASVIYDGLIKAKNEQVDVVIIDTAGRLQNKVNLMNELDKINRIIKREIFDAPHETLLVIDGVTGQNGISQAKNFSEVTNVTGIVLTKMDGTAKGGVVLSIKDQLNIPVKLIGLGEQPEDLQEFDIEQYIYNLTKDLFNHDEVDEA